LKNFDLEKIFQNILRVGNRFPLTILFIVALTLWQLSFEEFFFNADPMNLVFYLGILFSMTSQLLYERFFEKNEKMRWLLKGVALALILLYYFYIMNSFPSVDGYWSFYSIPGIRSMILFFIGIILFIWAPTIKNNIKFADSFLANFKNYFSTLFFSIVLFIGILLTLGLFQFLFFTLDFNWFFYSSTLIFNFFAPLFFLTSIPRYHVKDEKLEQALAMPKFLYYLISYILNPIMGLLTGIIVLYILTNLTSGFFRDNILEGLLLSYTINGWVLLLLAAGIDNNFAKGFRKIFPYALIFVVLLQMTATFLEIQEVGITHGRYFILLFGLGSVVSAGWYLWKDQELKLLPVVAGLLGVITLLPMIDVMSISVNQQRNRIEAVLNEYEILDADGAITPNTEVPLFEQERVIESLDYLAGISALNQLEWLPGDEYYHREIFFGIDESTDDFEETTAPSTSDVTLEEGQTNLSIAEFDQLLTLSFNENNPEFTETIEGDNGPIEVEVEVGEELLVSITENDETLEYNFTNILEEFEDTVPLTMSLEELTFTEEDVQIIVENYYRRGEEFDLDIYLLF